MQKAHLGQNYSRFWHFTIKVNSFRKFYGSLVLILVPLIAISQNGIYDKVISSQKNYKELNSYNLMTKINSDLSSQKIKADHLTEGVIFLPDFNKIGLLKKKRDDHIILKMKLPKEKEPIELSLVRNEILADDFILSLGSGSTSDYQAGLYYQGIILGEKKSLVAISIFDNELIGFIANANGNYTIGKLKDNSGNHIIYEDSKLSMPFNELNCQTKDGKISYSPDFISWNKTSEKTENCIRVYIEINHDVVADKGGINASTNFITGLFNEVITLYANENIAMVISEIKAWNITSPYTQGGINRVLDDFQLYTEEINGDIGHIITYINQPNFGQAAKTPGLCDPDPDMRKCASAIFAFYEAVPVFSSSVKLVAHEMGHLLGSRHTHACVWNGNNTALDNCGALEDGPCSITGSSSDPGTIMSYCDFGGVGVNFELGFGLQPGNVIRNTIANATCINSCNPGGTSCNSTAIELVPEGQIKTISELVNAQIIPGSSEFNADWQINGTLIVNNGYNLSAANINESVLIFGPTGKIIVQDAVFSLDNVVLKNCVNAMWQGIECQGTSTLALNNCMILNAQNGIITSSNTILNVTRTEFYNNDIAIDLSAGGNTLRKFYSNHIHSDGQLLWPHTGQRTKYGILVNNNPALVIGIPTTGVIDPDFIIDPANTNFEGLEYAIDCNNSEVIVKNCSFNDISKTAITINGGTLSMINYSNNTDCTFRQSVRGIYGHEANIHVAGQEFQEINHGIVIRNSGFKITNTSIVQNSIIDFKNSGIFVSGAYKFEILDNFLRSAADASTRAVGIGIYELFPFNLDKTVCSNTAIMNVGNTGIKIGNGKAIEVVENSVTLGANGSNAILVEGGNTLVLDNNNVSNFSVNNAAKGLFVNGAFASTIACTRNVRNETGINFLGHCEQTDFKGSNLTSSSTGLVLGIPNAIGETVIGLQEHHGNRWTGSYDNNIGAHFLGNPLAANTSRFIIDEIESTLFLTSTNLDNNPNANWFVNVNNPSASFNCPGPTTTSSCDLPGLIQEGPFDQEIDDQIAIGNSIPGFTGMAPSWILKRHLAQRINSNYTMLDQTTQDNFISTNANQSFILLESVNQTISKVQDNAAYIQNTVQINTMQQSILDKLSELNGKYSEGLADEISENLLDQYIITLSADLANLKQQRDALLLTNYNIITAEIAQAIIQNTAIVASEVPAQNEKLVNSILLNGLDESDISILETIALQCPLTGGDAVYQSRSFLDHLDYQIEGTDLEFCALPISRKVANDKKSVNFIHVYPNPANQSINIHGENAIEFKELKIYNANGVLQIAIPIEKGTIKLNIPTIMWSEGIYYYQSSLEENKFEKLIILH